MTLTTEPTLTKHQLQICAPFKQRALTGIMNENSSVNFPPLV